MFDRRSVAAMAFLLVPPGMARAQAEGEPLPDAATLTRQFEDAQREWTLALRAARAAKDAKAEAELRRQSPDDVFVPKFVAGAALHAGEEAAVPYLAWLVSRAPFEQSKAALTTLMDHHVESPGIRLGVARIGGLKTQYGIEQCKQWLDRVIEKNRDAHVLAQAHFTRAAMYVGTRAVATGDALRQAAIADLQVALQMLETVEDSRSLRGLAENLLDEASRLEPGLQAPDIEGADLDGVPFKLSDYRGKVVLLDFWGDW